MKLFCLSAAIAFFAVTSASAEQLPAPEGEVLLTVSGAIENETADGVVSLELAQLQALPEQVFTTSTIWTETPVVFTGVSLRDVLDHAGVEATKIKAVALNDYIVEIPLDGVSDQAPIIAYLMDGEQMSPRDKGPLWIVYPYDADPDYRTEVVYSRSIWQLNRIVAVK